MIELLIPLAIVVLVITVGVAIHNGIISRMNAVARAWADVVALCVNLSMSQLILR